MAQIIGYQNGQPVYAQTQMPQSPNINTPGQAVGLVNANGQQPTTEGLVNQIPAFADLVAGAHVQGANIASDYDMAGLEFLGQQYGNALGSLNKNYGIAANYQQPYYQAGTKGLNQLSNRVLGGFYDPGEFNFNFDGSDPGYQWLVGQGMDAVNAGANARGLLNSGGRLQELSEHNQGFANNFKTDELNRQLGVYGANQSRLNNLYSQDMGLTGIGQSAANVNSNLFSSLGQQESGVYQNYGNVGQQVYSGIGANQGNAVVNAAGAIQSGNLNQITAISQLEALAREAEEKGDAEQAEAIRNWTEYLAYIAE